MQAQQLKVSLAEQRSKDLEGRLADLTLEKQKASTIASAQLQVHCMSLIASHNLDYTICQQHRYIPC